MERLGEVDTHYVQDCIGGYAIPSAESLISKLVAEYIEEGGNEEDDSALDNGGIMAAVNLLSNNFF